jgi:hypothetical protein
LFTIPSKWEQKAIISSDSHMLSLKSDKRVVKAFAMKSGWQC